MASKGPPEELRLRAQPRPVVRLNRRTLIVAGAILGTLIGGVSFWALRGRSARSLGTEELHDLDRVAQPEGLAGLPKDYAKLGPPLGELGRPILKREEGGEAMEPRAGFGANAAEDAERTERMKDRQEADQAARAHVMFQLSRHESIKVADAEERRESSTHPADEPGRQAIYASGHLETPKSQFELLAGTVIAAALVTGLNSDLPGPIVATVTQNVYDSVTGNLLLIPQGSRLIGQYENAVSFGQSRLLFVWTRLLIPDGSSIVLDRIPGIDAQGAAGVADRVDRHWDRIFASAAVTTLIAAGAELAAPDDLSDGNRVVIATRRSVQDTVTDVGQQMTRKSLEIQPTLTIRPGFPVQAIVTRDLVLESASTLNGAIR